MSLSVLGTNSIDSTLKATSTAPTSAYKSIETTTSVLTQKTTNTQTLMSTSAEDITSTTTQGRNVLVSTTIKRIISMLMLIYKYKKRL